MLLHGWGWDQAGLWSGNDFHVVARAAVGVSRHGPWCRNTEAGRELRLGRDTLFGVTTWGRQLSVTTWVGLLGLRPEIGVATGPNQLVSQHGLTCLGSRPKFGVATRPGHGRRPGVSTRPLVSRPARWPSEPSVRSSVWRHCWHARPLHRC